MTLAEAHRLTIRRVRRPCWKDGNYIRLGYSDNDHGLSIAEFDVQVFSGTDDTVNYTTTMRALIFNDVGDYEVYSGALSVHDKDGE